MSQTNDVLSRLTAGRLEWFAKLTERELLVGSERKEVAAVLRALAGAERWMQINRGKRSIHIFEAEHAFVVDADEDGNHIIRQVAGTLISALASVAKQEEQ